ncbi:MAG TPA: hypothetical protein VF937_02815 [Chloroflexota bacterium]
MPDRLKPDQRTPILRASVEATGRATDLCTGDAPPDAARERILAWLAEGAREVTWAVCSLPRERWVASPPPALSRWPVLRHARHLALREHHLTLPAVRQALSDSAADESLSSPSTLAFERADAAWDPQIAVESAEAILRDLGTTRFELLQRLEAAPDEVWQSPAQLTWLLLHARQHELEHVATIWKVALDWDRVSSTSHAASAVPERRGPERRAAGLPLHPADRLEESH